ncbi:serine hydrolase [Leptobacterium flavescens]|uniref:Serine hydrolase n=1 Tax=Leptobacterium flavescens TaxID=472055 RepID=A0A6P0UQ54_9FLAO|nr:serine hydrolase [Leptobacterium flavescens]
MLSFFSFVSSVFPQDSINETPKEVKKAERIINRLLRKKRIPGIAVTVTRDQQTIWQKGYGYADLEKEIPIDPQQTIFRIASVSKPLSATALAKAVEEKKIDLDSSIYDYVPYFPRKKYDITLRQLGGHLAGIRTYKGREFFNKKELSIREGVALFEEDPLLFEPGTDYAYNSYDWVLISLAIQEATGVPYANFVNEKVLLPLEMTHTFPDENNDSIPFKTTYYSKRGKRRFRRAAKVNNYFKLAGGGFLSTSEDVARLGNAYLKGEFLPVEIASQFTTAQMVNNNSTYYGLGWEVSFDQKNRPYYGHTGNGIGGYAVFRVYPDQNMVFSLLTNVTNPGIEKEIDKIIDAVLDKISPSEKLAP